MSQSEKVIFSGNEAIARGLYKVAAVSARKEINIEDAYGFVIQDKNRAVMIFDVEDIPEAVTVLTKSGFSLLNDEEFYSL